MSYPKRLHKTHNSFPLAPEKVHFTEDDLSPYATKAWRKTKPKSVSTYKATKLTSTFRKRVNYVVHGANLDFYLKQGLKLETIHRAIRFTQKAFVKPYIDACTDMRAAAKTKQEKDLFKLLCNSLYGKVIHINRLYINNAFNICFILVD